MKRTFLSTLAMAAMLPLAACDDSTSVDGPSSLSLLLTDAPGELEAAWVTIDRIELVGEEDGVVVVGEDPFTVDLVSLQNDAADLLGGPVTVPSGSYSQLRFIVSGGCVVEDQGEGNTDLVYASEGYTECDAAGEATGTLQMPSFAQTGIKVNLPGGTLELAGEDQTLLLDWDVSQSFGHQAGNSGMWVMTPVINAEDVSLTGSLTVELTLADTVDLTGLGNATLDDFRAVMDPDGTAPTTVEFADDDADETWTATFLFMIPGDYDIAVMLEEAVTAFDFTVDPTSPQTVTVGSGEGATTAFEVTSAAASAGG